MVSASPSSADRRSTPPRGHGAPSGHGDPVETRAAKSTASVDFPTDGSPSRTTSFPAGSRPGQTQVTRSGVTVASVVTSGLGTSRPRAANVSPLSPGSGVLVTGASPASPPIGHQAS